MLRIAPERQSYPALPVMLPYAPLSISGAPSPEISPASALALTFASRLGYSFANVRDKRALANICLRCGPGFDIRMSARGRTGANVKSTAPLPAGLKPELS